MARKIEIYEYNEFRDKYRSLECIVDNGKCIYINKIEDKYFLILSCQRGLRKIITGKTVCEIILYTMKHNLFASLDDSEIDHFKNILQEKGYKKCLKF